MHSQEHGDILGVESCTEFSPYVEEIIVSRGGAGQGRKSRSRRNTAAEMEYPPPMAFSLLESVMKKHRTSDGRLVITEERVPRRQEYFQVHRSNGRLVLSLQIPLNNAVEEEEEKLILADSGDLKPPEEVYIGVEPCSGFGVAMAEIGLAPPVHTN